LIGHVIKKNNQANSIQLKMTFIGLTIGGVTDMIQGQHGDWHQGFV